MAVASAGPYASLHLASLQTDNHASTPPLSFLQDGCPSCHPTNSVKALKAKGVLPTKWRQKPAGIDMNRNYVTVNLVYKANKNSCVSSLDYCTDSPQKKFRKRINDRIKWHSRSDVSPLHDNPFPQPFSRSSLVIFMVWGPLLHTPHISYTKILTLKN